MSDRRRQSQTAHEQAMQLLWAPPSYDTFDDSDLARFRLLLNHRGWCVGLVWATYAKPGQLAKAGVTWNTLSKLKDSVWSYLSQCANEGVYGAHAYDAVVAETRGAGWSREFVMFGGELDQARVWMQGFSDDACWARGVALPPRASQWSWADPDDFTFHAATGALGGEKMLVALGPEAVLLRDEGKWWVVPAGCASMDGAQLVEIQPGFHTLFDKLGPAMLEDDAIVSALSASWTAKPLSTSGLEDEDRRESARPGDQLIPDNAEWLLIETMSGWAFQAGATRLVPALWGSEHDRLSAPDAVCERISYALRHGAPLSFPEGVGTPLNELSEGFWLISLDNGDWTENLAGVVLVEAPEDLELDNTEEGAALALGYTAGRGQVPRCSMPSPRGTQP